MKGHEFEDQDAVGRLILKEILEKQFVKTRIGSAEEIPATQQHPLPRNVN
jgi:hypothetical protein